MIIIPIEGNTVAERSVEHPRRAVGQCAGVGIAAGIGSRRTRPLIKRPMRDQRGVGAGRKRERECQRENKRGEKNKQRNTRNVQTKTRILI